MATSQPGWVSDLFSYAANRYLGTTPASSGAPVSPANNPTAPAPSAPKNTFAGSGDAAVNADKPWYMQPVAWVAGAIVLVLVTVMIARGGK